MYIVITVHFRATQITQGINHHITQVIEVDHPNEEIHEISHKIYITDRIAKTTKITIHNRIPIQQKMFLDPVPNQTQGIDSIPIINHETHHTTEIETIQIIEIEVIQTTEIRIPRTIDQGIIHIKDQTITDQTIIIKTDHEIFHRTETQVRNNNRYRNYSQSPHRNNSRYPDSKHRYRSSTPKHQRHINQVRTNEEITSDPPGIDDTGSNELQLNHIN